MPKTEVYENGVLIRVEDTRTLDQAREEALYRISEKYEEVLKLGYTDPILGVTIGSTASDQQAFVNDLSGLAAAEGSGISIPVIAFADLQGGFHQVTPTEYRALLGRAWAYARTLWGSRIMAEGAIRAAPDNATADSVQLGGA